MRCLAVGVLADVLHDSVQREHHRGSPHLHDLDGDRVGCSYRRTSEDEEPRASRGSRPTTVHGDDVSLRRPSIQ